jgi:putative flippase GtrA
MNNISIFRDKKQLRFLFAGLVNTFIGLIAFPILYFILIKFHIHYLIILAISTLLTTTFSFLTNKYYVFRSDGEIHKEFGKFLIFHLSHFCFNLLALPILIKISGLSPVWAQTIFAVAVIVSSYIWHNKITFGAKSERL